MASWSTSNTRSLMLTGSESETTSRRKMKWSLLFVAVLQLQFLAIQGQGSGFDTCKSIKQSNPTAPSKMYTINVGSPYATKQIDVYCEMGLNGGGYTFLTPESIGQLTSSELTSMFTDNSTFLLRVRKTDGTQPFGLLKQLSQYADVPLRLLLNSCDRYNSAINGKPNYVGEPYVFFGFLPISVVRNNSVQGLQINGYNNIFNTNPATNSNSQFVVYPNFGEVTPSTYDVPNAFCDRIFSNLLPNPSGRVMPPQIYMFGETHWGGACFKQTNLIPGVLSFAIGFR